MLKKYFIGISFAVLCFAAVDSVSAQIEPSGGMFPGHDRQQPEETERIKEMLSKQQAERDKKDHAELLKRGEEVLTISGELERSFTANGRLTEEDNKKLEALEKLAVKIRNELGGGDDGETSDAAAEAVGTYQYLKKTTKQLVDEIKKTSRFSISAVAIEASNTIIRLTRLLRTRKL